MKKKLITGVLVIVLSLALAVPAGANDMAKAGASHPIDYNAAIKTDGTLWLWGDHTPCSKGNVPTQVAENIKAVSISGDSVAVIKTDNTLWLLNDSPNVGNVKVMDNVAAVSCNKHNSLNPAIAAIKTDGTLWMWGDNSYGQLGNGSTEDSSVPIQVMEDVSAVSIGFGHTVALKKDGSLWAWGYNSMSQLGNGWKGNVKLDYGSYIQTVPVQIMKNVVAISAGDFHTAAIKTDGTLWMWGQNDMGQLGNGNVANSKTEDGKPVQSVPLQVMKNVAAVSAGRIHTAAIKTDGSLWTWGFNRYGQIGNGDGGSIKEVKFPVRVMDKAAAVSAADYHTVALKTDGSLWAWGENRFGSVGNGGAGNMVIDENTTLQTIPVKIMTGVALPNSGTTPPPSNKPSDWAQAEVSAAIKAGIVPETLQQNYTSPVTRQAVAGMFIDLIEEASGKNIDTILQEKGVERNPAAFTDTSAPDVLAANALGIINGVGENRFAPTGTFTRGQIAAIINRAAGVLGVETQGYSHSFADASNHWCSEELGWPVHAGVLNGVSKDRFAPDGKLTTEQAIVITYRALEFLK